MTYVAYPIWHILKADKFDSPIPYRLKDNQKGWIQPLLGWIYIGQKLCFNVVQGYWLMLSDPFFWFIDTKNWNFNNLILTISWKSWQKKRKNKNRIQIIKMSPVASSIICIGWCYFHGYVPRLNEEHVFMRFLKFLQQQMYCSYLYFSMQNLFKLYLVAWVDEISNMCDIYLFLVFDGLPHVFLFIYELLINTLAKKFHS